MNDSILQQSKNSKSWKRPAIIAGIILVIGLGSYLVVKALNGEKSASTETEIVEVTKGNIVVSVQGEGKLINPNIVNLSFLINGTLDQVNVKEGQMVKKGDIIATLDQRDYAFDLKDAQNQVNIALANIRAKEAELTDQSLRLAKDDMISAEQSFKQSIQNYEQDTEQAFDSARITLSNTFPEMEDALRAIDEIFSIDRQASDYEVVPSAFHDNARENRVRNAYRSAKLNRDILYQDFRSYSSVPDSELGDFLARAESVAEEIREMLEEAVVLFDGAVPSSIATQSLISSAESSVQSALGSMSGEVSSLNNAKQSLENAVLSQRHGVEDAEKSLESSKLKLENTERDYERSEINKQTSLSVQYAQLQQSQVKVEKAKYNLSLTTLVAPIDGEITVVNGKPGETIKADTASAENAFVRIISDANFETEVFIEEVDIARISKGQTAIVTLDAIPDVELEAEVTYVSNVSTIDNNGVTTYLVRVEITNTKDAAIREGMTSYVEFIEHQALDALLVPATAVLNDRFVFDENGERIPVRVGISDNRMTEIYEGVELGQRIMARPPASAGGTRGGNRNAAGGTQGGQGGFGGGSDLSVEERMERIGERLRESGNLPEGWDKMSTADKQKALEQMREAQGGAGGFGGARGFGGGGGAPRR